MKSQNVKRASLKSRGDDLIWCVLWDLLFVGLAACGIVSLLCAHNKLYKAPPSSDQIVILLFLSVIPILSAVLGVLLIGRGGAISLRFRCSVVPYFIAPPLLFAPFFIWRKLRLLLGVIGVGLCLIMRPT